MIDVSIRTKNLGEYNGHPFYASQWNSGWSLSFGSGGFPIHKYDPTHFDLDEVEKALFTRLRARLDAFMTFQKHKAEMEKNLSKFKKGWKEWVEETPSIISSE